MITWINPNDIDQDTKETIINELPKNAKSGVIFFEITAKDVRKSYMIDPAAYTDDFIKQFDVFSIKKVINVFIIENSKITSYKQITSKG